MTLERLQNEMIAAMKNKDKERKETISGIIQAVRKFGIDNMCKDNVSEEQIDAVILKEKKTAQEMIDTCPAEREKLMRSYRAKMAIIDEFAPRLISDPVEIKAMIEDLVENTDLTLIKADRGKFMKILKGKVDMKIANQILSCMLQ